MSKSSIGDHNRNGQILKRKTDHQENHPFATIWELECKHCGREYGANSCDFHERRCPNCQDGKPGV